MHENVRIVDAVVMRIALVGKQRRVAPARQTVLAPVSGKRPAWQLLAGIPLTLPEVQESSRRVARRQLVHQLRGKPSFGRAKRRRIPLFAVAVQRRDERRLPAHRQPHVARGQIGIHRVAERFDIPPLLLRVGFGHARGFLHPEHLHLVHEFDFAGVVCTRNGRGRRGFGRARHRNVPFAGQQARCRIQADPAGAGQVNLGPCMQVREVRRRPLRPFQRLHVGNKLDQVARHKPGSHPQVAQHLHQQPRGIAARPLAAVQRFLWRIHPGSRRTM